MPEDIRVGSLALRFLCSKHDTGGALDMFEMTCPPNARMPVPHYHRDWDETIYGLSGVLTLTVDGELVEIAPGDTVHIRRGVVHGLDNRGACVLTPGVLGPEYFREIGAELAANTPDRAKLRTIMERHGLIPAVHA